MNIMKKHANHGISAFELTQKTLNNLKHFNIGATAKNVLWYLTSCYNPKNKYIFPKQKTIANVIGCSERSVVRAIQELTKEGLILIECKVSNKYVFTSKILGEQAENDIISQPDGMSLSDDNLASKSDNLSPHDHEQTKEKIIEPQKVEDFKILKKYAIEHNAKNVNAYINALRRSGNAKKIIEVYKKTQSNANAMLQLAQNSINNMNYAKCHSVPPTQAFKDLKQKLCNKM